MSSLQLPTLALDSQSLNRLKFQAKDNQAAALAETAKQFESLFMRELMKSMREASQKSGLLESQNGNLGEELLDQQWAVELSGKPNGLSKLIVAQLSRQMGVNAGLARTAPVQAVPAPLASTPSLSLKSNDAQRFIQKYQTAAEQVSKESGIPPAFMLGQAAHETGWGQRELMAKDGSNSNNLFGIKATASWTGRVVEHKTTEYVNGVAQKSIGRFRAYDSPEDSFRDYVRLISQSPRYAQLRQQTGSVQAYANGLQKAGYATDPHYAAKLSRSIHQTLDIQRGQT